jgi:hypothetical protein
VHITTEDGSLDGKPNPLVDIESAQASGRNVSKGAVVAISPPVQIEEDNDRSNVIDDSGVEFQNNVSIASMDFDS